MNEGLGWTRAPSHRAPYVAACLTHVAPCRHTAIFFSQVIEQGSNGTQAVATPRRRLAGLLNLNLQLCTRDGGDGSHQENRSRQPFHQHRETGVDDPHLACKLVHAWRNGMAGALSKNN